MPASLFKCDVEPLVSGATLSVLLPTIFRVVFVLDFCSGCDPGFACFTAFPVIGMLARTRFWSILDPTFTRVSQYFKIRVSILPYQNSFPDTLPIQNKNPYLQLFRFFKKQIKPEKWPAGTPRYLSLEQFCPLLGLRGELVRLLSAQHPLAGLVYR